MKINEISAASSDNKHTLRGVIYQPEGKSRGYVQIVHGMSEYIGRYEPLMSALCENGYTVFGHDHVGHGKTADSTSELGFIREKDGHRVLIDDVGVFAKAAMGGDFGTKRVLFGHSMGSFVVRLYAAEHSNELSGLIVMGTGGPNPLAGVGIATAKLIQSLYGANHISKLVNNLAFGAYNKKTDRTTDFDWLSVDTDNVTAYINDPLCGYPFTVSSMKDLVTLNRSSNKSSAYKTVDTSLPIFILSGRDDPVGAYGEGVKKVSWQYKKAGIDDVTLMLYDNLRHEILKEADADTVINDIVSWINRR